MMVEAALKKATRNGSTSRLAKQDAINTLSLH
jgi:hypothetical protein